MGLFLVAAQDAFLESDRRAFFNRPRVIGAYFGYMGVLVSFLLVRLAVTGVVGVPETFVFDNPLVEVGAAAPVAHRRPRSTSKAKGENRRVCTAAPQDSSSRVENLNLGAPSAAIFDVCGDESRPW